MLRNIAHSTASENTASPAVPTLALESICLKYCKEFVGLPGFIGLFPLDMQKKKSQLLPSNRWKRTQRKWMPKY